MKTEPVAIGGTIVAVVQAILGVLAAFNLPLSDQQQTAVVTLTVAVIALTGVVTAWMRSRSTPAAKVVEYAEGNTVVAGEASDRLAPGDPVRPIGETMGRTVDLTPPEVGADGVDDTPRRSLDD